MNLKQFASSLMPESSELEFPHNWFAWPPDVFALTSAVFERTGCYRHVVSDGFVRSAEWQRDAEAAGNQWWKSVNERLAGRAASPSEVEGAAEPELVRELRTELAQSADKITMEQLRVLGDPDAEKLTSVLLKLHAIADEACTGLGLPGNTPSRSALAHCLANLLLVAKGSLSSLPEPSGVVLPKMRTPQKGLTLRSLALHLTYHATEVEVMWRVTQWPNLEENTLNLLAIPWPPKVQSTFFHAESDTLESVRYFRFKPNNDAKLPTEMESEQQTGHLQTGGTT